MWKPITRTGLLGLLALSLSCSSIVIDESMNAALANDTTIVIEGCGNQPISGFTYCRRTEGRMNDRDTVILHIPEANCEDESCVTLTFFSPDGEPSRSHYVPRGWRYYALHWSQLTGVNEFRRDHRGFWMIAMDVYWVDNQGAKRRTTVEGEIRLRVLRQGYRSLWNAEGRGPYAYAWNVEGPHRIGYTTSGRSSVWKR